MKQALAYQNWPLAEIHRILSNKSESGLSESRFHLDAALLLSVGLVCRYYWGLSPIVMLLAVAAVMTGYMAYYSGVAFLKSVPARVRLANPRLIVEVDHLFLAKGSLWGAERMIVIGLTALGLLSGWPELGLAAAVIGGNIYWITKSLNFWRKPGCNE